MPVASCNSQETLAGKKASHFLDLKANQPNNEKA